MPFFTSEIRWFSTERRLLQKVYESIPCSQEMDSEHRTDRYARGTGDLTGIKMRSGMFEAKFKIAPDRPYPEAFGKIEKWVKWSSSDTFMPLEIIKHTIKEDWIAVEKTRMMKRFESQGDGLLVCRPSMDIARGCAVEITEIKIEGIKSILHTLCFEAFGEQLETEGILRQGLRQFTPDFSGYDKMVSCGYPEFLNKNREA